MLLAEAFEQGGLACTRAAWVMVTRQLPSRLTTTSSRAVQRFAGVITQCFKGCLLHVFATLPRPLGRPIVPCGLNPLAAAAEMVVLQPEELEHPVCTDCSCSMCQSCSGSAHAVAHWVPGASSHAQLSCDNAGQW